MKQTKRGNNAPVNSKPTHPPSPRPTPGIWLKFCTIQWGIWSKMRPAQSGIWLSLQNSVQHHKQKDFVSLFVCLFFFIYMCSRVFIYFYLFAIAKREIKLKVGVLPTKWSSDYRLFPCKSSKNRFQFWVGNLKFMEGWSSTLSDWLRRTLFLWRHLVSSSNCLFKREVHIPRAAVLQHFLKRHRVSIYLFIYLYIYLYYVYRIFPFSRANINKGPDKLKIKCINAWALVEILNRILSQDPAKSCPRSCLRSYRII